MRLRLLTLGLVAAGVLIAPPGWAAKKKKPEAAPVTAAAAPAAQKDTVVASVEGHNIYLSDVSAAAQELPQNMQNVPAAQLYPLLVDRLVDREALVLAARKQGLQNDPAVKQQIARADDTVLQNALLRRDIAPKVNDEAQLRAMYDKEIGSKPGEQEVKASHILVPTQAQAQDIIAQLNKGADFATLAKKYSTDPSGTQSGGDLGYFKQGQMVQAFSDAAFALPVGQITQTPVHSQFGWHVIKVFDKRLSSPQTFADAEPQLKQELISMLLQKEIADAKLGIKISYFNSDGTPAKAPQAPAPSGTP